MVDPTRLTRALEKARLELLAERGPDGHWTGLLSSSALSTATAISALTLSGRNGGGIYEGGRLEALVAAGLEWLTGAQNADGGWGDTDKSRSNIATTMLVQAAFRLAGADGRCAAAMERAGAYVAAQGGAAGLARRYGKDKTFAVPILTNCALAGLVEWRSVAPLPFELACLPRSWFRFLRLPVVSYAIPALVAIGQARFVHAPPVNPVVRWMRRRAMDNSLRLLEQMQPASGGFLEATPLTSFVVMSLASIGQAAHPVARLGVEFLMQSARADGAWPIDTNLATWVTTLSIQALAAGSEQWAARAVGQCAGWLLSCQHRQMHPFTAAARGGFGWSDLSGAVPDADDTAGALLALAWCGSGSASPSGRSGRKSHGQVGIDARPLARSEEMVTEGVVAESAALAVDWLLDLQNGDGGWPTFCRGWGRLPFDRSGTDLTAHAMRALARWRGSMPGSERRTKARIDKALARGLEFLEKSQQADGSWLPLWFGNQDHPEEANPIYGTSRVLLAYAELGRIGTRAAARGLQWLCAQSNPDGGFGSAGLAAAGAETSSVEETALAVDCLSGAAGLPGVEGMAAVRLQTALSEGLGWLVRNVEQDRHRETAPIGFYFAKLWYYEALYPLIFTVSALGRAVRRPPVVPDAEPALSGPLCHARHTALPTGRS